MATGADHIGNMERLRSIITSTTTRGSKGIPIKCLVSTKQKDSIDKSDDGQAAQRIISSCFNELLAKKVTKKVAKRVIPIIDVDIINSSLSLEDKLDNRHMDEIILTSEIIFLKSHSTKKRKLIISLCSRMKGNDPSLVRIRLNCQEIDDMLLKQISPPLARSVFTKEIFLNRNSITNEGIKHLVTSLHSNTSLTTLSLGGNLISDHGAELLSQLCTEKNSLKQLNISNKWPVKFFGKRKKRENHNHPHITSFGISYFAVKIAERGCSLVSLYLSDQRIGQQILGFVDGILFLFILSSYSYCIFTLQAALSFTAYTCLFILFIFFYTCSSSIYLYFHLSILSL